MSDTETLPPPPPPAPETPVEPPPRGLRGPLEMEALDKKTSRVLFVVGLVALVLGGFVTEEHKLPPSLLVGWIALFIVTKLVLAGLGARAAWKPWPALVAEASALGLVGYIVRQEVPLDMHDSTAILLILAVAVLLAAAALLRRRAARALA